MFGDGLTVQPRRFTGLFEDARTIQKAQAQFQLLSAQKDAISLHQAVRWLVTKEEHAGKIIENMSEYMLAQRIKPPTEATGPKQDQYLSLLLVSLCTALQMLDADWPKSSLLWRKSAFSQGRRRCFLNFRRRDAVLVVAGCLRNGLLCPGCAQGDAYGSTLQTEW